MQWLREFAVMNPDIHLKLLLLLLFFWFTVCVVSLNFVVWLSLAVFI